MMGYAFGIIAIFLFVALFFLFRATGGGRSGRAKRNDYRKGTTYEQPQAEEPPTGTGGSGRAPRP